jgi:putative transposase
MPDSARSCSVSWPATFQHAACQECFWFATVRHRTIRSKGSLSNGTALAMVFKLVEGAQKGWRRLDGHNQLPKLVLGVTFADGIEVIAKPTDRQPTTAAA